MKKIAYSLLAISAVFTAFSCAKNIEDNNIVPQDEIVPQVYTCVFPGAEADTKVSLANDGKTGWEVGDEIFVHGQQGSKGVTIKLGVDEGSSVSADGKTATFTAAISDPCTYSSTIFVAYPASAVKDNWDTNPYLYWSNRFKNTNAHLLTGYNDTQNGGTTIRFINLCACISFIVNGDFDGYVFKGNNNETVGYSTYTVRFNNNKTDKKRYYAYESSETWCDNTANPQTTISVNSWTGANGATVNKIFIPYGDGGDLSFPDGFTIQFLKGGSPVKQVVVNSSVNMAANKTDDKYTAKYLPMGDITDHLIDYVAPSIHSNTIGVNVASATDLSASATSNCYIVDGSKPANAGASFKFKAAKGKGGSILSTIGGEEDNDVVVLWETQNTDTAPNTGEIIAAVDYDKQAEGDAYIVFKMPATLKPGNAVIAAKNAGGQILWSWHIWVPSTTIENVDGSNILGATVMDRNLGALDVTPSGVSDVATVTSLGLVYQWGRKDPFPGPKRLDSDSMAKVAGLEASMKDQTYPEWVDGCKVYGHMTIDETIKNPTVYGNVTSGDWDESKNKERWQAGKKTIYDPCPVGYKVMDRISSKPMWSSSNDYNILTNIEGAGFTMEVSATGYWIKFTDKNDNVLVFPLAGYVDDSSVTTKPYFQKVNRRAAVYSTYYGSSGPYHLNLRRDESKYKNGSTSGARGCSIRCVAE